MGRFVAKPSIRLERAVEEVLGEGVELDWNRGQLPLPAGEFVLDGGLTKKPRLVASMRDPKTGRVLEILTTEPGMQLYSGNFLDGKIKGKGGKVYAHRTGFCLETQHYPDSPNHPLFPPVTLRPGKRYQSTTLYRFTTDAKDAKGAKGAKGAKDAKDAKDAKNPKGAVEPSK